jgi:hypothetical protein
VIIRTVRRSARFGAMTLVATAAVLVPTDVGGSVAAAADACALVTPAEATVVVGAATSGLQGPVSVQPGTCSWSATESTCTLRSLSLAVQRGDDAAARFAAARGASALWTGAPGVGDDAFYTADALPAGSAVMIQHLHVLQGDTTAVVTIVGRIGPETAHDLLGRVGGDVAARLGARA